MIRRVRVLLLSTVLLGLAACDILSPNDYCDICSYYSEISGVVVDADDLPVQNADIVLWPLGGSTQAVECRVRFPESEVTRTLADANGEFGAELISNNINPTECVEVTTTPPEESGLRSSVDTLRLMWNRNRNRPPVEEVVITLAPDG